MNYQEAIIFTGTNKAFYPCNEEEYCLSVDRPEPRRCSAGDISFQKDIDHLYGSPIVHSAREEILKELQFQKKRSDVLFFILSSMDPTLDHELRYQTAKHVEDLLADQSLEEYAEKIMLSECFRGNGSRKLEVEFRQLGKLSKLILKASELQPSLAIFWNSWDELANDSRVVEIPIDLPSLRDAMLAAGTVPNFVESIRRLDLQAFNREMIRLLTSPGIQKGFAKAPHVFTRLRGILEQAGAFGELAPQLVSIKANVADEDSSSFGEPGSRYIESEMSTHEIYGQVRKQIEGSRRLLFTGSLANVSRAVNELLSFQEKHGSSKFMAMTLCNLSKIALEANEPHLADHLTKKALSLNVDDIVVYTSEAEVLKNLGHFTEAKEKYELILERYGKQRYPLNGYADVLKEMGKYREALEVYEVARSLFPDDPVAPNGIATVLFAMGDVTNALDKARANVSDFGDVVSRIILGNILRHLGRYHEAARLLRESVRNFPSEPVVWYGLIKSLSVARGLSPAIQLSNDFARKFPDIPLPIMTKAELLRRKGDLTASLETYSKGLRLFSLHRPLQIGKAAVLILLGRVSEATEELRDIELDSETDWRAFHMLALATLQSGDINEARKRFSLGLENAPWRRIRNMFSDSLGYAELRAGNQVGAIELLNTGLKEADNDRRQGLYLLISRAYVELGDLSTSGKVLQKVKPFDNVSQLLHDEIRRRLNPTGKLIPFPPEMAQAEMLLMLTAA